jgi:hypothetical protein
MKRFELLIVAGMLILAVLWFGQKLYPQVANLFSDTARKIEAPQVLKV